MLEIRKEQSVAQHSAYNKQRNETMLPTIRLSWDREENVLHCDYDRLKLKHSQAMLAYHYNRGAKDLHVL